MIIHISTAYHLFIVIPRAIFCEWCELQVSGKLLGDFICLSYWDSCVLVTAVQK